MSRLSVCGARVVACVTMALALIAVALAMPRSALAQGDAPARPTGPCDIYAAAGTPCVAAHSTTRALYAAYDGPLYQVKRQSDGAVQDIGVVAPSGADAGGYADAAAQDAFCADTVCWITILYDQSPNHNDLTRAPRGGFSGPAMGGANNLPIADMAPITVGGHKAYGVFIEPGMGLRDDDPVGTAVDDQPEDTYWVIDGHHFNDGCCFDYGNAEIDSRDDGNGTMETTYFGNATAWYHGPPPGPWIMTDQENNLVGCVNPGSRSKLCPDLPSIDWRFATGVAKGEPHHWASLGGNAQSGELSTMFDGPRVDSSYDPMRKQGAIVLGNGGDNSNGSQGTFYEGVMTAGYPADSVDQLVQANIRAADYQVHPLTVAPPPPPPVTVTVPRIPGRFGSALPLDGETSQAVALPEGIVDGLHDFTVATWVNPQDLDTWSRVWDFGSGTGVYMFLTVNAGGTGNPRFAITVNSNGDEQVLNAPDPLPVGQWTHIAVTLNGTTGRMYVNGVQVAENTDMTLDPSDLGDTTQNYIGKSQWPDPLLNGVVDDFQIYDHALSAGEIAALQSAPGAGDVAGYKFDEAGGDTVPDSSGNHNDGTVLTPDLTPAGPPGLQTFAPGSSQDTIVTFTNTGDAPATGVQLSISVPAQWSAVKPGTADTIVTIPGPIAPGDSASATFTVTSGPASFDGDIVAHATWTGHPSTGRRSASLAEPVRNTGPVKINEYRIGSGDDSTDSFIELYNAGADPVDISGWTLTEHPTREAVFSTVQVPAGITLGGHGFYLLGLSDSGLAAPASAGDTTINVRSTAGMNAGDTVEIGSGADAESRRIVSVGSDANGSTTLWQPLPDGPVITIPAGSTSVPVTSTNGFEVGQKVALGFGDDLEVATVTAIGERGTQARLSAPAHAGDTNLKVSSTSRITVGDRIRLDVDSPGHGIETVTVADVGTSGDDGTGLTLTDPLKLDHSDNLPFSDWGTGISFTPATRFDHSSNEPVQGLGTGVTLDRALTGGHGVDAVVRDAAVTSAGYQGARAPDQWFGGPELSAGAGSMVLRDAAGDVSDSLDYGELVDPWAAEGYQAASGAGARGCTAGAPSSAGPRGRSEARFPDGADNDSNCTDFRTANGTRREPTPGTPNFVPTQVSVTGQVGGTVPATLALGLGAPAAFGTFTPGVAQTYSAATTANVTSTAGDAALSVADPTGTATGHLVNGSFALPQALTAKASSAAGTGGGFTAVGGSADPATLLTYAGPTSNDAVAVAFQQAIGADDALRTGSYSKTLTFTLSTTNP